MEALQHWGKTLRSRFAMFQYHGPRLSGLVLGAAARDSIGLSRVQHLFIQFVSACLCQHRLDLVCQTYILVKFRPFLLVKTPMVLMRRKVSLFICFEVAQKWWY